MFKDTINRVLSYVYSAPKAITNSVKKALFTFQINRAYLWKVKAELDTYRSALDQARNAERPDRRYLYGIYREVELDDQVISQTRIASVEIQRAPFEILSGGKVDKERGKLFRSPLFFDFLDAAVKTEFWGHSLIEFNPDRDDKGHFKSFWVIPRDHVRPEFGDVLKQISDTTGIPFRENPKEWPYAFEIGRPDDLGLYHVVAIPVIRKRFSDTDWGMYSERFGSPFLTVKTASRDKKELDAKEAMAANFGSNGYAILDDQDEINAIVTNHTGTAHYTFKDRMDRADDQIAKLINGQTGSSDEKAYVGSAEVHERILNAFTFQRLTRIQYLINFRLIPFLVGHGYTELQDVEFEFTELREKQPEKETNTDRGDDDSKPGPAGQQKKSPNRNAALTFSQHYSQYFHEEHCQCPHCQESTFPVS